MFISFLIEFIALLSLKHLVACNEAFVPSKVSSFERLTETMLQMCSSDLANGLSCARAPPVYTSEADAPNLENLTLHWEKLVDLLMEKTFLLKTISDAESTLEAKIEELAFNSFFQECDLQVYKKYCSLSRIIYQFRNNGPDVIPFNAYLQGLQHQNPGCFSGPKYENLLGTSEEHFGSYNILHFMHRNKTEFSGVVIGREHLTLPDSYHLIITFAGTKHIQDWYGNAQIKEIDLQIDEDFILGVHGGFANYFEEAKSSLMPFMDKFIQDLGCKNLVVTTVGHSLGGCLSLITAVYLKWHLPKLLKRENLSIEIQNLTYGMPAVFTKAASAAVERALGKFQIVRVFNERDLVPRLNWLPQYCHVGVAVILRDGSPLLTTNPYQYHSLNRLFTVIEGQIPSFIGWVQQMQEVKLKLSIVELEFERILKDGEDLTGFIFANFSRNRAIGKLRHYICQYFNKLRVL